MDATETRKAEGTEEAQGERTAMVQGGGTRGVDAGNSEDAVTGGDLAHDFGRKNNLRRGQMKKTLLAMVVGAMGLVGCGGAPVEDSGKTEVIEEAGGCFHGTNGKCAVDPATGLETGACIGSLPCGCGGVGSASGCVPGRAAGSFSLVCGTLYGDNNSCKIPGSVCGCGA